MHQENYAEANTRHTVMVLCGADARQQEKP